MARVIITGPAKQDVKEAYDWWAHNRSAEQAKRWYGGMRAAMRALRKTPERCAMAIESDLLTQGIRQLNFGLGRRPTHRIVFAIDGETSSCYGFATHRRMRCRLTTFGRNFEIVTGPQARWQPTSVWHIITLSSASFGRESHVALLAWRSFLWLGGRVV